MKVLIAEDDAIGRRVLELFLKPYAESKTASDGEEAYQQFLNARSGGQPFDLIFLDIGMPKLKGIDVLKAIRDFETQKAVPEAQRVKVIMLTGQADAEKINTALNLGASDYLLKPIEESKLLRELQRLKLIEDPEDKWE